MELIHEKISSNSVVWFSEDLEFLNVPSLMVGEVYHLKMKVFYLKFLRWGFLTELCLCMFDDLRLNKCLNLNLKETCGGSNIKRALVIDSEVSALVHPSKNGPIFDNRFWALKTDNWNSFINGPEKREKFFTKVSPPYPAVVAGW